MEKVEQEELFFQTTQEEKNTNTDSNPFDSLSSTIYAELKKLANYYLSKERPNHTLQPTELVHEVYLRMVDQQFVTAETRTHFLGIAARLMRQILVDYARTRYAAKREGNWVRITLDKALGWAQEQNCDLLDLEIALDKLTQINQLHGQIIELVFFGGLTFEEVATLLKVSERTVQRYWKLARAWLYNELRSKNQELE